MNEERRKIMRLMRQNREKGLTPYDMVRNMNRVFEGLWPEIDGTQEYQWAPAVDICEKGDSIKIKAELPGIPKDAIEIEVANGVLTIRGEKKIEEEKSGDTWHRREMRYGSFTRSFSLPPDVKHDKAEADFADGVLTITIPKEEKALHRKITIKG